MHEGIVKAGSFVAFFGNVFSRTRMRHSDPPPGNATTRRCIMGGLVVHPNKPSPWYEFEMLKKSGNGNGGAPTLFLHFKVGAGHTNPVQWLAKSRAAALSASRPRHIPASRVWCVGCS